MSTDRHGILVAEDGGKIDDPTTKYDSRRPTLIVDIDRDPKHMQIVETKGGISALTDSGPTGRLTRDVMYEMSHNLGYIPIVDAYFYARAYDGSETSVNAGIYGNDVLFFSGSAGTLAEVFTYEVDEKNIRLVRYFDAYFGATGYTTTGQRYDIRTKFYIYSINSGRLTQGSGYGYDGNGTAIE